MYAFLYLNKYGIIYFDMNIKKGKNVVISMLGSVLDAKAVGKPKRFEQWRPNVAIALNTELAIDQFEFVFDTAHQYMADSIKEDIKLVNPHIKINTYPIELHNPWDFQEVYAKWYEFACAYPFVDENNYFIHMTTGTHVSQICLFLLTESHFLRGKLLQTSPQGNTPKGAYQIVDLDLSKYDLLSSRFFVQQYKDQSQLKSGVKTRNSHFNELIAELEKVAVNALQPILLLGATGVGKTQLAQRIYALKKQRQQLTGQWVSVNCATLRGEHLLSTLFGHVKGAFTGAVTKREGLLKKAHKGLLFLDEIGELGANEQAMLLQVLEEKTFTPLGSDTPLSSDFQLLAGTNTDLYLAVQKGLFRADLLARLNIWQYHLPALCQRREDIAPNLDYELAKYAQTYHKKVRFNQQARHLYLQFAESENSPWYGNFRDLNASVIRMAVLAEQGVIGISQVQAEIVRLQNNWQVACEMPQDLYRRYPVLLQLDEFEQVQLAHVIRVCLQSKSQAEAGRKLFAVSRQQSIKKGKIPNDGHRLHQYLKKFNLNFKTLNLGGCDIKRH